VNCFDSLPKRPGIRRRCYQAKGVQWEAVDATSPKATVRDSETTVTLLFRFLENGSIESVRAEGRGRPKVGAVIPTPWEVRWINYQLQDGMRIPVEDEVAWMLSEGPRPYYRGRIIKNTL
jgi:Family of unknown function (DUF6920)